jgi:hypothetical protein
VQKLGKVLAVLAGDTGDERARHRAKATHQTALVRSMR